MAVRITGLNSGLDTDSIVKELVKSYSGQKDNIKKKQTKLEWKQDAWKDINTKIYNFYSSQLSNLRWASAYKVKSAKASDETKATVKASNTAAVGTQKLEILETAQAGYLTGSKLKPKSGGTASSKTDLSALGITGDTTISVEVGGATKKINVNGEDTIQDLVQKFRDSGINASFDADSQRFFLSSKETGEAGNFNISVENYSSLAGAQLFMGDVGADSMTSIGELGIGESFDVKVKIGGETKTITIDKDDKLYMVAGRFEALGLKASFNEGSHKFILTKDGGEDVEFQLETDSPEAATSLNKLGLGEFATRHTTIGNDTLKALGLLDKDNGGDAVKIEGKDAKILLNDAEFTSKDGNFSINGLTINALQKTNGAITINTSVDSQGIYDSIKKFFKEYNDLMKEMDTLFNADSAKGFEPLTDDEKEDLSEGEIEKWEKKIKDSLLRRDSTLGGVAETLRTALAKSYTINGKTYSLSTFGISTQSYLSAGKNEKNLYHIDGDSEDSLTKSNNDKLLKAVTEDPDGAAEFFSQLIKGAYDSLDKKMRSTTVSSAYVVYNDKQITKDLKDYDDKLKKWEDKVKYYEDFYYKKFSGMETALANLQSSQNSLSMLLGQ